MGKPLFKEQFSIFPQLTYCPQYDPAKYEEIQAFYFEGMPLGDEKTRVFAYMGLPRNRKWPAPAVVLVHGGGCHPDCEWIRQWTERGYIALAMDTTGYFPAKEHTSFCEADRGEWQHALPEDIKTAGYTVSPDNSEMKDIHVPLKDRWMYHAVSQVILAHNILLSDSRVDADRIGISGISWGDRKSVV